MSPNEIASILRACRKAGVEELKLEGLEVKFRNFDTVLTNKPIDDIPKWPTSLPQTEQLNFSSLSSPQQMSELDELSKSMKHVEDPYGWEMEELSDEGTDEQRQHA